MNRFWEKFFYLFTYLLQGSSYLTPRAYGALHRMHHAYSDSELDPHSPHYSSNIFTMMWKTRKIYNELVSDKLLIEEKFAKDLPEWKLIDKIGESNISRIGWGVVYLLLYSAISPAWYCFLLLPVHFLMGPVQGAIVNWFGHKVGYTNFENNDYSRNTLVWDFLMLGELFQNNHHKHSSQARFSMKKFEIDPVWPVIRVLHSLNILTLKNPARRSIQE